MLNGPNDSLSAQMILIHLILCISMGDIILHLHIFRKREKKKNEVFFCSLLFVSTDGRIVNVFNDFFSIRFLDNKIWIMYIFLLSI